jgi:hypothetical protein
MRSKQEVDAHLDPWCEVPMETGGSVLFGFALHHAETGGLAWLSSSQLVDLKEAAGRARTMSGRRYRLGRRFDPLDVGAEGEEARLAFALLIGVDFEDLDDLVEVDRRWLQARKAARHLGLEPPIRTDAATRSFFETYGEAYVAIRQRGGRPTS